MLTAVYGKTIFTGAFKFLATVIITSVAKTQKTSKKRSTYKRISPVDSDSSCNVTRVVNDIHIAITLLRNQFLVKAYDPTSMREAIKAEISKLVNETLKYSFVCPRIDEKGHKKVSKHITDVEINN